MSYDLMVFDPASAPKDKDAFMAWYGAQTEWTEDHSYADPTVSTPQLRAWFLEMIHHFPAMNGPYASEDEDEPRLTDYSLGKHVVYAAFPWSAADDARRTVRTLAMAHSVGFFDASSDDPELWFPE